MEIAGRTYVIEDTYDNIVTIPDCFVLGKNKIGHGHGEAKLYHGSKQNMRAFYGEEGFFADCFVLKNDLLSYLDLLKEEYNHPTMEYAGRDTFPSLWKERHEKVNLLDEVIWFTINDQVQIEGPRGYINSSDGGYKLIRELSLPLATYISAMRLRDGRGQKVFYWKLFVDVDVISEARDNIYALKYGRKTVNDLPKKKKPYIEIRKSRIGQGKYRESLLEECPFCPITMVNDERLLIASHIKPWIFSNDKEKIDPKNGYALTPLYDKLFDKGFISFTEDRRMMVSNWLSPRNQQRLGLINNKHFPLLPMDEKRKVYLQFHRDNIYKG